MIKLKPKLSLAVLAMTILWTSCQKEASNPVVESSENTEVRSFGALLDDPGQISSVPLIMSADFLAKGEEAVVSNTYAGRGKKDLIAPTLSINSPVNGATVSATVSVLVKAADNIGVTSVSLSVDGNVVTTSTLSPFTTTWNSTTVANGSHTLKVTAKDAAGNLASSSIQVVVSNVAGSDIVLPVATISSPVNGSSLSAGSNVNINISASDNVGITSLTLAIDGTVVGTTTNATYAYTWNTTNVASGAHIITAKGYDKAGNIGSKSVSVTVNTTTLPPTPLPSAVNLNMPAVAYQGSESGCVAFALLYSRAAEQYYRTGATSYAATTNIFSAEFLFNQTKASTSCSSGASMINSLNFLVNKGVCTSAQMPYSDQNGCSTLPSTQQTADASNYRIKSYSKVVAQDPTAIKTMLYNKRPLSFTFTVDANFYNAKPGYIWNSYSSTLYGPHAITLVGYDDTKKAYKAINQWGTGWGDAGYIWIDYTFFTTIAYELYALNP